MLPDAQLARLDRLLSPAGPGGRIAEKGAFTALLTIRHADPGSGRPAGAVAILPTGTEPASSRGDRPIVPAKLLEAAARRIQAAASGVRLTILVHLLAGPSTYAHLKKVTGLAAGPLYFHLGRLRLASLIGPAERNIYELSSEGRVLLAGILLTESILPKRSGR